MFGMTLIHQIGEASILTCGCPPMGATQFGDDEDMLSLDRFSEEESSSSNRSYVLAPVENIEPIPMLAPIIALTVNEPPAYSIMN